MITATDNAAGHAILKRRAELLARQPPSADGGDDIEVLVCRLGDERYAVATASLRAVQVASNIASVPCTPPYVMGIVNVRGEIVALLHLATMLGLTGSPPEASSYPMLLLGLGGLRAGLVVDEVLGVERLPLACLQPSLTGRDFARAIAPGPTVLLDLEHLLMSGRFDVSDDPL